MPCTHESKVDVVAGGKVFGQRCVSCGKVLTKSVCAGCGELKEHEASAKKPTFICKKCVRDGKKYVCVRCKKAHKMDDYILARAQCEACSKLPPDSIGDAIAAYARSIGRGDEDGDR
jgi:hypothetical protein